MKIATLFPHTALYIFGQKFRESNVFTIQNTKKLISRNFFSMRENFSAEKREIHLLTRNFFSSNQFTENSSSNTLI